METTIYYIAERDLVKICLNCRHFIHGDPERKRLKLDFHYVLCGPNSSTDKIILVPDEYKDRYLMGCTKYSKLIEGMEDLEEEGKCPLKVKKKDSMTDTLTE